MNDTLAHGSKEQSLQSKMKCGKSPADVSSEASFTYQAPSKSLTDVSSEPCFKEKTGRLSWNFFFFSSSFSFQENGILIVAAGQQGSRANACDGLPFVDSKLLALHRKRPGATVVCLTILKRGELLPPPKRRGNGSK